jgi:Uri superfamily endonuclease
MIELCSRSPIKDDHHQVRSQREFWALKKQTRGHSMRRQQAIKTSQTVMNATPGTYILVMHLEHPIHITIGKQPSQHFLSGYYLYIGSAFGSGGLRARVGRHLRDKKKMRWHIDYLLAHTSITAVWFQTNQRLECTWSKTIASNEAATAIKHFGASDCRCLSHLYTFKSLPDIDLNPDYRIIYPCY